MNIYEINFKVLSRCFTFNQSKYILDALNGFCMQQTNFPYICCIVDDASTDGEQATIKDFFEENFVLSKNSYYSTEETDYAQIYYAQHKQNKNCFFAIYLLKYNHYSIKKDKIGYLAKWYDIVLYEAMCEGDDYWTDPKKLQMQIDFLDNHHEHTMIFHDAFIKNEPGIDSTESVYPKMENRDYSATEIFQKWTIPTASVVFKKEILYYPIKKASNILNGDIFLAEKCAHMGKIRCINKKMSVYRRQPGGVTWDASLKIQRLKKYPNHYKELKRNFPLINRRVINRHICGAFVNAWDYVGFTTKISFFFQGIILAPRTFLRKLLKKIIGTKPQFSFLG